LAETVAHDEQGITSLCDVLLCFEVEIVAIERGDGVLVERLLDAGVRVLALHPNQVKAARDRFRASGGKSDRFRRPAADDSTCASATDRASVSGGCRRAQDRVRRRRCVVLVANSGPLQ
jgi:hypothetical protein